MTPTLHQLLTRKDELALEKLQIEVRLGEIKSTVRGHRLPNEMYNRLCSEQAHRGKSILLIQREMMEVGKQIREEQLKGIPQPV